MSEISPAVSRGADAPAKPPRIPHLSDEAESILHRRAPLRGRNVTLTISRLNLQGEYDAVRRENEVIIDSFRKAVADRYGPSIAGRTVRDLRPPPARQPTRIDRRIVTEAFQQAHLIREEVCARPEVQAFLPGGDRFSALCRRFGMTGEEATRNYKRALIDAIAAAGSRAGPERLAQIAATAAQDCAEFVVRPEEQQVSYRDLIAMLAMHPGERMRFGRFAMRGISSTNPFANFGKTGSRGIRMAVPPNPRVESHGDKIHLSVNRQDIPAAWDTLQPLLLSGDSPFLAWKMTIPENEDRNLRAELESIAVGEITDDLGLGPEQIVERLRQVSERITEGMQFTLYAYAGIDDPGYTRDGAKYRHFVALLERALTDRKVRPGRIPQSDVPIGGFAFATYRNERIGTRGTEAGDDPVTQEMRDALENTPFYRAINR